VAKTVTTAEAAERLGTTPARVRALIRAGRLRAVKLGRRWAVNPISLEALVRYPEEEGRSELPELGDREVTVVFVPRRR